MGPGIYADERHKMKLGLIGLPISWRAELDDMIYNWFIFDLLAFLIGIQRK